MPLNPQIAHFLSVAAQAAAPESLSEMRAAAESGLLHLQGEAEASGGIKNGWVTASDGHDIAIRAYTPLGVDTGESIPAMLYAHGGGWCLGSLTLYDRPCQALANATGRMILSVDYRLAPEYPYPRPLDDVYQALCGVIEQADEWGFDATRIAVGGDSAGGNLAAAVALLARDRDGPQIDHQLLLYPALSRAMDTTSYADYAQGYFLTREVMAFCWRQYLPEEHNNCDPYAEPLHAATLSRLPPATILSCEYDPLRDEAEHYARRLQEDGVAVRCERLPGMVHACIHMLGLTPAARELFDKAR
ncbi:Lipase 2 [Serratia grimesii]|jgi:acetyl esterase|uniref:Esterase n=1 Tax=Serratia grimesii TaxID=82995 RepID=A0ABR4UEM5_9GAMM|nr:alpha/beta hydrolase [Serratia grimesii]KFB90473.1 esterase [Serratia grimesii]CAI0830907.1 Lipase 2 [Serratia grimesii]CAI1877057.1 Lipase 2 [Serratia grimesii]